MSAYRRPAPAFQLYASDLAASAKFREASMAERGLLMSMLAQYWIDDELPSQPKKLARRLGIRDDEIGTQFGELILAHFRVDPANTERLVCLDLDAQKARHAEMVAKKVAAGRKGGKATQSKGRATGDLGAEQDDGSGGHALKHMLEQAPRQVVNHAEPEPEPEPEMKSVSKKKLIDHDTFDHGRDDSGGAACAEYSEWMSSGDSSIAELSQRPAVTRCAAVSLRRP